MSRAATRTDERQILYRAERLLKDARNALLRIQSLPPDTATDHVRNLRDVAVHGEASLRALEHLRTNHRAAFDQWYLPYEREMVEAKDELMYYFRKLRNQFLKEGRPAPGEAPSTVQLRIDTATDEVVRTVVFTPAPSPPRLPTSFRGNPLANTTIEYLCPVYVEHLTHIYERAEAFVADLERVGDAGEGS